MSRLRKTSSRSQPSRRRSEPSDFQAHLPLRAPGGDSDRCAASRGSGYHDHDTAAATDHLHLISARVSRREHAGRGLRLLHRLEPPRRVRSADGKADRIRDALRGLPSTSSELAADASSSSRPRTCSWLQPAVMPSSWRRESARPPVSRLEWGALQSPGARARLRATDFIDTIVRAGGKTSPGRLTLRYHQGRLSAGCDLASRFTRLDPPSRRVVSFPKPIRRARARVRMHFEPVAHVTLNCEGA
jgi:hypothetical protein